MKDVAVEIIENKKVNPFFSLLTFKYPLKTKPGQFVHVKLNERIDPFLRRPFSIHDHDRKKKTVTVLYKLIGRGTRYLAGLPSGSMLSVLGPLGNSFDLSGISASSKVALIGGGIGFAPLLYLAKELADKKATVHSFLGFKTKAEIFVETSLKNVSDKLVISTDDGTAGECGFITGCFEERLKDKAYDHVFVCGPEAMMRGVHTICKKNEIPLQLSLESIMACGIGACMCCVTETEKGYKKVCSDGPVFKAEELSW